MIGFYNGEYLALNKLVLPVDSLGVSRAIGAFDFLSVINSKPFCLDRHLNRFKCTTELLRFTSPYFNQLQQIVSKLIDKNESRDFGIKILAFPTQESNPPLNCDLFVFPIPLAVFDRSEYQVGSALLLKAYKRFLPEAKTTNYLASQYFKPEVEAINAIDVLYHDNGLVRETSRGNIFIVENGVVKTPANEVLSGVTRSVMFDLMSQNNIPFSCEDISLDRLFKADEVFVSSSTKLVLPIVRINDKLIGAGEVGNTSRCLFDLFVQHKQDYCK